jgi:RNA polymerase sigma factor (sigma-70 family)
MQTLSAGGAKPRGPDEAAARKRAAVETYTRHEAVLRRTAARYSLCADDADDALQRGLEILLRKAPTAEPRELVRWMQTVVKHEALAVRRERERVLAGPAAFAPEPDAEDWVALLPSPGDGPAERLERREAVGRSREALQALKPQELRALTLLAEGYSYAEIGEITRWSRTKVNRCLAEGRERFRSLVARGEDGSRCRELRPLLSAFCDGEADRRQVAELREHLRACGGCRATLRAYRAAPAAAAALAPAIPLHRSLWERIHEAFGDATSRLGGGRGEAVAQIAGGSGAGGIGLAKVAAVCIGAAGSAGLATGVVPTPFDLGKESPHRIERQHEQRLVETPSVQAPSRNEPDPAPAHDRDPAEAPDPAPEPQPAAEAPAESEPAPVEPEPRKRRTDRSKPRPGARTRRRAGTGTELRWQQPGRGVRPMKRLLALIAGLSALLLGIAAGDSALASGGGWQASPTFDVDAGEVPGVAAGGTRAIYRLLDPQGEQIGDLMEATMVGPLQTVEVPRVPGAYTLEGRLEDAAGKELRRASTLLRFDDAVPPPPAPRAPGRWLLGGEQAVLALDQPSGPLPLSGISAYEVVLNPGDVRLTASENQVSLGFLPEGVTEARVVALSGAGVRSEARTVAFAVDATAPAVSLAGIPGGWSSGPVKLVASARDGLSGMDAAGPAGPFTAIVVDGASPVTAPGATASTWVGGSGIHTVRFYGRDAAGNVGDGGPGSPPPQTAIVRIDEEPPRVQFAAAQDPADPERIEADVSDPLSGPGGGRGSIGVRPVGTRGRFEALPTRVDGGRLIARWDSDAYPPGKYEFLATGFDLAGNSATGAVRARGGRMVLVNPLKTPVTLTSRLAGMGFSGSLRRTSGGAVAGQAIAIRETFAAGADQRQRTTLVHTSADGTFSLRLKPGPSREVVAGFDGSRLLTRAGGPVAHLTVASKTGFHASASTAAVGGRPVLFRGKVGHLGARRAVAGLPVELQFRYPGADWSEFRTVEADRRGRFRYAYRFSDDDSRGVRFQFRAYVKGREGWPYGPSASRPVSVRGR